MRVNEGRKAKVCMFNSHDLVKRGLELMRVEKRVFE